MNKISIKGEVSNCKYHSSGHIYFTLKDQTGTLSAVMFASQRRGLSFQLQEGQQVIAKGQVSVYERDGRYQLYVKEMELDGNGNLYERFLKLKQELEDMGMFAGEYKQRIPKYAQRVGVVTASTGAAIRDIMNITARRNPYTQLVLFPALVQGEGAKQSIVKGIQTLDTMDLDVIIVGRGGGSIEDLWAFNEEVVARAIFEAKTPIISAVGHETDVTIADYVADLRAPTPSAAAELAVFDYAQFESQIDAYSQALTRTMERRLERKKYQLEQFRLRLKLYHPGRQIDEKRQRLADIEDEMRLKLERQILEARHRLALNAGKLQGLSPLEKISKGFGFVTDGENHRIESVKQVKKQDLLQIQLADGKIQTQVLDVTKHG